LWAFLALNRVYGLTIGKRAIALHNTGQMLKGDKNLIISRFCLVIAITIITGLVQGCASFIGGYGPDGQSREDFERRVEAAFRLQNRMTSEVMVLQPDNSKTQYHLPIIQAEQVMAKHCSFLNEYVSRDIDGKGKSFLLLRRVQNSIFECESSARKIQGLLKTHQP
jgi:hypothetical protein